MTNPHDIKIGQKLVEVVTLNQHNGPRVEEIVIRSVGRKWATYGEDWKKSRVNLETLEIDGREFTSPGKCFLSMEAYREDSSRAEEWKEIYKRLSYNCPSALTLADVRALRKKLFS